ncbi:calmodulin-binding transcription activator 2 isoform X2 [Halichoeres trimaculatus]|uniref:calmodulin-binding transcription activator 2 isoform X2 n=1 Tax=Halichoeres trimaculatus TaxID=147232 RepID=UPI003D9F8973
MSNKEMVSTETENKGQRKVFLPNKLLECLPRLSGLPKERLRWNTNEEIASYLISFDRHDEWLSCTLKTRPKNGSIILYNRKKVKYRKDGYCWKKRKDGKTTREDHMKLKVQGMECLYGCYVHSSIVPTFHRRCYWLLQNPDIVLVHYLNVPSLEDSGKCSPLLCAVADRHDSVRWSRDDLLNQLKPMFHSMKCSVGSGDFSIEELVQHILDRQRTKPQPRTHACLCNTGQVSAGVNIPHRCNSTKHRIISPKLPPSSCRPSPSPLSSEGGEAVRGGGGGGEAKPPHLQTKNEPASSPCPTSTSASSPPQTHRATITVGSHGNGFYNDHHGNVTTVALPQNAVIVMATTAAMGGGGGGGVKVEEAGQGRSLSLTHSGQLVLSPAIPPPPAGKPASPSPPSSSSPAPPSLPPPPVQVPGVATLSLTLLPSPVIGGLLLTPSSNTSSSLRSPHPPAVTSPPSPPSSPSPPPPPPPHCLTPVFDPDAFLNSPKQGQTYGGPPPPSSSTPSPVLCSSSPLSPPSLALSLSPTSTPPSSVSPPSSLSSLSSSSSSEVDRKDPAALLPSSSSSLPPSLSLTLSPTSSVAQPLLPLCLELGALGEAAGREEEEETVGDEEEVKDRRDEDDDDDDDDEGSAPPTKLALLQTSHTPSSSPRQQAGSSSASLLLVCPDSASQPANQAQQDSEGTQPLVRRQPYNHLPALEVPPSAPISHQPLLLQQSPSSFTKANTVTLATNDSAPTAVAMDTTHPAPTPVQVKEERRRDFDSEDNHMDTHLEEEEEEAEPCGRGGEELDISFDSQFPDLISDLMTEEANPMAAHPPPPVAAAATAPNPAMFPAGVRYMVPPQPSPSSSFLPFPHPLPSSSARLASITDFSPEWSYPEGGVKVLITGPWSELAGRYSCVFDQSTVPASLIQPGVLRCYCPAHEAGLVCLQVLESGGSVSSSVLFEYRARNASSLPSSQLDWLSLDDNQFRMSILERLEQMERRMAEMAARDNHHHQQQQQQQQQQHQHGNQLATPPPPPLPEEHEQSSQWFERRIVGVCERMMKGGRWGGGGGGEGGAERLHHSVRHRGMTLLHLAAAQGYTHLIHTLIHWRSVNSDSLDLEQEVDPLNIDHFSCTPLMWACALGHQRAAELLYGWNSSALGIPDSLGRLPLAVARSRGHTRLAMALEELHTHTHMTLSDTPPADTPTVATPQPQLPPSPLSTSPDTGLSSSSSLPSPSDPSSPSPSSAYSSGPAPMDTSPSSPSSLSSTSSSLPVSPPSPSSLPLSSLPPVSMWGEEPNPALSPGLNACGSRDSTLYLMDYESACPASPGHAHTYPHAHTAGGRRAHIAATLEEQLLSYSENAENEGEEEEYLEEEVLQVDMATLAEQIIEATPERIKQEDFPRGAESPLRERRDNPAIQDTWLATYLDTVDAHTHSPPRRVCPPSPLSALALQRLRPPSSAAWAEFLNASANGKMERDFALLTLTDGEQRELYEAARIIQNAFRRYKGRRLKEQQDMAAAVIQRCYRKYKQLTWIALKYALYKKMTQAAILIQSKFRSYYEQKRFQQSRRAAVLIQQYYRSYKEYERLKQAPRGAASHNPKIKGSFLTKKQDQAARKIMRFLRRCRHRIKELKQTRELERRGLTT